MLDDLGADDRALAEDDLEDLGGQSGLDEQVTGPERGERGLRVGLHDDGVARDEGGERVADGELQRVVPGRDLADDPARLAQLGDLGEGRDDTGVVTGAQVGGGLATVVAGGDGDRLHLLVGVQACLAGLQLDEVEDLGLPLEDEVVEAQQDGGAGLDRGGGPDGLGGARAGEGLGDVLGVDSGRSASFAPVKGVWLAVRPEPTTPRVSRATTSGVTTSAAVRAPAGAGATGLVAAAGAATPACAAAASGTEGAAGACESVMRASVGGVPPFGYPSVTRFHRVRTSRQRSLAHKP